MGILSGGGFFGSGGKTNSGNTSAITSTFAPNTSLVDSSGNTVNNVSLGSNTTGSITIDSVDYGAVSGGLSLAENAINGANALIDDTISAFANLFSISSADNKAIAESSMMMVSEANNNVTSVAADSLSNSAYLSDSVIASTSALGGQFGSDLAYLTDAAMTNNAILVDKTIGTVDLLTAQHQESLNNYGNNLAAQASQYSADVGFLSQQSIQGNNELTALFGGYMADNSNMLNLSMLEMANLQEQGLDSALKVAGNVALDDSVEGIQNMVRYLSIALGAVGVAFALRKFG